MESAKQKVSNMASAAKEKIHISKAKTQEKAEKATARTKEEREMATEVRKMKEADAKAELHGDKARHAAKKLESKQPGHHCHFPCTGSVATGDSEHHGGHGHVHQTYGAAGSIPPTTTTAAHAPHYQSHPPAYHKHL